MIMKALKAVGCATYVIFGFALIALLIFGPGCKAIQWDGTVGGVVPVSALEAPLNVAGQRVGVSSAGTLLLRADAAAVKAWGADKERRYKLLSETTNHWDSTGQATHPPYYFAVVPEYAPVTNQYAAPQAAPVIIDSNAVAEIINAYLRTQGHVGSIVVQPVDSTAVETNDSLHELGQLLNGGAQ